MKNIFIIIIFSFLSIIILNCDNPTIENKMLLFSMRTVCCQTAIVYPDAKISYELMPAFKCSVPPKLVGVGKVIVEDNYCNIVCSKETGECNSILDSEK